MRIEIDLNPLEENEYARLGGERWLRGVLLDSVAKCEENMARCESDVVQAWVDEQCELRAGAQISGAKAWRSFEDWERAAGTWASLGGPVSRIWFGRLLRSLAGVTAVRTSSGIVFRGLGLRAAAAGAKVGPGDPGLI